MPIKVSGARFEKKLKNARELIDAFGASGYILEDTAAFVQKELINTELNYNPIGVVTGNLRRSYSGIPQVGNGFVLITSNLTIAPYAPKVAAYSKGRFGSPYTEITVNRIRPVVDESVAYEVRQAARVINSGGNYSYKNPFPA